MNADFYELYVALRLAAQRMCHAYAGEMAARNAGIEVAGFPLLDAYQALMKLLYPPDEALQTAVAQRSEP